MRLLPLPTATVTVTVTVTMAPTSSAISSPFQSSSKPLKKSTASCPSANSLSKHPPSAILDLLILLLVLFSAGFLIFSYLSYLFHSFSLLLPSFSLYTLLSRYNPQPFFFSSTILSLFFLLLLCLICCGPRSGKCGNEGCRGFRCAMEYNVQVQDEECLRMGKKNAAVKEIDELPWKGGTEFNPDYESLREELRKMAPPNGRAVLIFRYKCGCPFAKVVGWGPKGSRRQKKALAYHGFGDRR